MKKSIQIVLSLIILIISLLYLYLNSSKLIILKRLNSIDLFFLIVFTFFTFCVSGYIFKLLLDLINVQLTKKEIVGLSVLTSFGNYLGPTRPGAVLKAVYLKSSKNLPYTKFVSVMSSNSFLLLFMTSVVSLILLVFFYKTNSGFNTTMYLICIGLLICSASPFIFKIPNIKVRGRITRMLQSSFEGFNIIYRQKVGLFIICFTFLIQFALSAFIYYYTFISLGVSLTFLDAFAIGVFTSISNFFTITPNNLGLQEAVVAYLLMVTGFDFATGAIGAGLLRAIHFLLTFTLGPIFVHLLLKSQNLSLKRIFNTKA